MSIIAISSDPFGGDADVAKRVADRLGHAYVGRDLIREASQQFDVPEAKLLSAIESPPSVFKFLGSNRAGTIAFYRAALLGRLRSDNVVCSGFANYCFVREIEHSLKVRLVVHYDDRIEAAMSRGQMARDEAKRVVLERDDTDRQWGLRVFGIDPRDPMLYDTVIHVGKLSPESAIDIVCRLAEQKEFETTSKSQRALDDLALAARVQALTIDLQLDAEVSASDGEVLVQLQSTPRTRGGTSPEFDAHFVEDLQKRLLERCVGLLGVKWVKVELTDG